MTAKKHTQTNQHCWTQFFRIATTTLILQQPSIQNWCKDLPIPPLTLSRNHHALTNSSLGMLTAGHAQGRLQSNHISCHQHNHQHNTAALTLHYTHTCPQTPPAACRDKHSGFQATSLSDAATPKYSLSHGITLKHKILPQPLTLTHHISISSTEGCLTTPSGCC